MSQMAPSDLDATVPDTLLSYSRADAVIADRIAEELAARDLKVWLDTNEELPGAVWVESLQKALETTKSVVLLVSPCALESYWVKQEYYTALARRLPLIPALVKDATMPPFVDIRQWVDFRKPNEFHKSIEELVSALRGNRQFQQPTASGIADPLTARLWWLWFFPEGLSWPVYRCLLEGMDAERTVTEEVVNKTEIDGAELVTVNPQLLQKLGAFVDAQHKPVVDLLRGIADCFSNDDPFDSDVAPGFVQLLLLRDILRMYGECTDDERDSLDADRYFGLARQYLSGRFDPTRSTAALQVSWAFLELADHVGPVDRINHARLLMCMGRNRQAADILSVYVNDLFDIPNVTTEQRIAATIDWGKAEKGAGRARMSHPQILGAYKRALDLEGLNQEDRAILLNNRATQIAIFDEQPDWNEIRSNLEESATIWRQQGYLDECIRTRANFVALSLDRLDAAAQLQTLQDFLDATNGVESTTPAGEDLFFFYYQKARLWKRRFPNDPQGAAGLYRNASEVAVAASLIPQGAIAKRWVLSLEKSAGLLDNDDYLQEATECAERLSAFSEDAWAANSLRELYLNLASTLEEVGRPQEARDEIIRAFEVEASSARRGRGGQLEEGLKRILSRLIRHRTEGNQFIDGRWKILRSLLGGPSWKRPDWDEIATWVAGKVATENGNTI